MNPETFKISRHTSRKEPQYNYYRFNLKIKCLIATILYFQHKPSKPDDFKSDDEFLTASECTLQHSRSSSYNTASECEHRYSPWWEYDKSINEDISKEKMVLAVGLPELPPAKAVLKPSPEVPPGKIVHEVTETTHIKVQHSHTLGVASFVLTSETVREKKTDGAVVREEVVSVAPELEGFEKRVKEVSGFEEEWRLCTAKQAIKGCF